MIYTATLPAQGAGGADVTVLAGVYSPSFYSGDTVTDAQLVAPPGFSTVNGGVSNNVTISVRQLRNGTPIQTFANLTVTTGVSLGPEIPVSIPITQPPTLLTGDVLDVQIHQNGAGQAVGAGLTVYVFIS